MSNKEHDYLMQLKWDAEKRKMEENFADKLGEETDLYILESIRRNLCLENQVKRN